MTDARTPMQKRIDNLKSTSGNDTAPQHFTGVGSAATSSAGDTGLRLAPKPKATDSKTK
jgi:hypothetical protein